MPNLPCKVRIKKRRHVTGEKERKLAGIKVSEKGSETIKKVF